MVLNLVRYIYEESNLDLKLIALPPIKATRITKNMENQENHGRKKKIKTSKALAIWVWDKTGHFFVPRNPQ